MERIKKGEHRLLSDVELAASEIRTPECRVLMATRKHPNRDGNQDAAIVGCVSDAEVVLAVADGMGGGRQASDASRQACESLWSAILAAVDQDQAIRTGILDGFETANRTVMDWGVGAATTLNVVHLASDVMRSYHAGDSLTMVTGSRGKLKLQTVSHSPVGYGVAAGLLNEDEALVHQERHLVSNMIGDAEMRIDVGSQLQLAARDTTLLATDGLTDNLSVDEIVARIRSGPLDQAAAALDRRVVERMDDPEATPSKPDDTTFILVRRRPESK